MKYLLRYFLLIPFVFTNRYATGQTQQIDSLILLLRNAQQDTTKINLNFQLSTQLSDYDIEKSDKYLEEGYALAKSINSKYYRAYYFKEKGGLLFDMAKYDSSRTYFDSAILLYNDLINNEKKDEVTRNDLKLGRTDCFIGKGLLSAKLYNYYESNQYYMEAVAGIDGISSAGKNEYLGNLYADIASNYYELEQFENALKFDKQGLLYLDKNLQTDMYVVAHLFVADDFSGLSQFDSSSVYLEKVRPLVMELNKPNLNLRYYYILGGIFRKKKDWNNALINFQKAQEASKKVKDEFQLLNSEEGIAACYFQLGEIEKAKELSIIVLNKSDQLHVPLMKVQSLQLLTEIEEKSGNIKNAYRYQKEWIQMSDSIKKEKVQRQMHETEVKYQNEKKQKEILELQKNNAEQSLSLQKKSTFNYFLIGSVTALLITGFLGYRNFRHRQQLANQQDELQQQRISELEKDRQLVVVGSMLKGQEDERSRLAKDLHDGLGGLLSGVKFSLSNMKDNLIITPENMAVFERSLDMLDTSIKELRRVAHNMMPEILTKFGLNEALKEYCNTINATKMITVKYQSHGMGGGIEKSTEIIIYRIIQELLNNIMKHAGASEAFVQLVQEGRRLNVGVEDNGKGFDAAGENNNGAGLANIKSRVEYLKGRLDINSEPGKGTLVNIEFNL